MDKRGIYAIYCKVTRTYYVGMTKVSFLSRWSYHIRDLLEGKHSNKAMQRDFIKYGVYAFSFTIVEIVDDERLIEGKEKYWINIFAARYRIYNVKDVLVKRNNQ